MDSERLGENTVKVRFKLTRDELLALKGNMRNVHAVTPKNGETSAKVLTKGEGGKSVYFDIPRLLKLNPEIPWGNTTKCYRFDKSSKQIFCFVMDKYDI